MQNGFFPSAFQNMPTSFQNLFVFLDKLLISLLGVNPFVKKKKFQYRMEIHRIVSLIFHIFMFLASHTHTHKHNISSTLKHTINKKLLHFVSQHLTPPGPPDWVGECALLQVIFKHPKVMRAYHHYTSFLVFLGPHL